jgi:hypothetical protein
MRREVWLALAGCGLVVAFAAIPRAPTRLGPSSQCRSAIVVHGELRCDDEAARAIEAACGSDVHALAGDVVHVGGCNARTRMHADDLERLAIPIDVNTATPEDLASLRGVGPVVAARIVEGRPYASVDDLERVKGIGPKTLLTMRPRVALQPPRIR